MRSVPGVIRGHYRGAPPDGADWEESSHARFNKLSLLWPQTEHSRLCTFYFLMLLFFSKSFFISHWTISSGSLSLLCIAIDSAMSIHNCQLIIGLHSLIQYENDFRWTQRIQRNSLEIWKSPTLRCNFLRELKMSFIS